MRCRCVKDIVDEAGRILFREQQAKEDRELYQEVLRLNVISFEVDK